MFVPFLLSSHQVCPFPASCDRRHWPCFIQLHDNHLVLATLSFAWSTTTAPLTRWCNWHSVPRAHQLWPSDGKWILYFEEMHSKLVLLFCHLSLLCQLLTFSIKVLWFSRIIINFTPFLSFSSFSSLRVGDEFSRKPYALAVQQGSPLKDQFNDA